MFRELKFTEATYIEPWKHLTEKTYQFSACTKAAKEYEENLARVHSLVMVPGYAFMIGTRWHEAGMQVQKAYPTLEKDELSERTRTAFWTINTLYTNEEKNAMFREGTWNADCICSLVDPVYDGFRAVLQSIVIQSWAAFELLIESLNDGARELHPECFSQAALSYARYGFRSSDRLIFAYEKAFDDDPAINQALWNTEIKSLALLRHLFVHQNGKVDQMHIDQRGAAPIITRFDGYGLDKTVPVDGEMVRSLVDPVTVCAYKLIGAVDGWLSAHKP